MNAQLNSRFRDADQQKMIKRFWKGFIPQCTASSKNIQARKKVAEAARTDPISIALKLRIKSGLGQCSKAFVQPEEVKAYYQSDITKALGVTDPNLLPNFELSEAPAKAKRDIKEAQTRYRFWLSNEELRKQELNYQANRKINSQTPKRKNGQK